MFNPSPTVRLAIYAITSLVGILVTYLSAVHKIGPEAVTAFGTATALVAGLASYNVKK